MTKQAQAQAHTKPIRFAKLPGYLAGVAGIAGVLGSPQAEAAVTAITFGFGNTLTNNEGIFNTIMSSQDPNNFGFLRALNYPGYALLGGPNPSDGKTYATSSTGHILFFNDGVILGSGSNGTLGLGIFNSYLYGSIPSATNKNIGFQTSAGNYGWANVDWDNSTNLLTVNSAYLESVAGAPITVGDVGAVPEPSRALLMLAGLGGVALRRRRKLVA